MYRLEFQIKPPTVTSGEILQHHNNRLW